jgi:hypothetical protein
MCLGVYFNLHNYLWGAMLPGSSYTQPNKHQVLIGCGFELGRALVHTGCATWHTHYFNQFDRLGSASDTSGYVTDMPHVIWVHFQFISHSTATATLTSARAAPHKIL